MVAGLVIPEVYNYSNEELVIASNQARMPDRPKGVGFL
jgi:hypothetical protein